MQIVKKKHFNSRKTALIFIEKIFINVLIKWNFECFF